MKEESCSIDKKGCETINKDGSINLEKHWCNVYTAVDIETLGWYEKESKPTLELIGKTNITKDATMFILGAGASTLIDSLVEQGYSDLIVNDISSCAMSNIKARLAKQAENIEFITDDIVNPEYLNNIKPIDFWIDRAVLHFFTEEGDQNKYFKLLNDKVKKGAYVILAEFNLEGAEKCSGLAVKRYNTEMLQEKLGAEYNLIENFDYDYYMPSGKLRKYVYTLFQRNTK